MIHKPRLSIETANMATKAVIHKDQQSKQRQIWQLELSCKRLEATPQIIETAGRIGSRLTFPKLHLATLLKNSRALNFRRPKYKLDWSFTSSLNSGNVPLHLPVVFSQSELHGIYTQQLEKHFIIHATQSQHIASDTSSQEAAEVHSQQQGTGDHDKAIRDLLSAISHVTVELQDHLRGMFLPTAQRCHYIFTMKDLTMVFRFDSFGFLSNLRPGSLVPLPC